METKSRENIWNDVIFREIRLTLTVSSIQILSQGCYYGNQSGNDQDLSWKIRLWELLTLPATRSLNKMHDKPTASDDKELP